MSPLDEVPVVDCGEDFDLKKVSEDFACLQWTEELFLSCFEMRIYSLGWEER